MSKNKKSPAQLPDTSQQSRKVALSMLLGVLKDGQSLSTLVQLGEHLQPRDAAFARLLSFGVLRFYQQLEAQLKPLMKKPLKVKDLDVQLVMMMALYQIQYMRVPDYAVVDAAVKYIRKSKKQWAASMVNAVLRGFIRLQEASTESAINSRKQTEESIYSHPQWIIDRLKIDWPVSWAEILQANNQQAPMILRVNQQKKTTDEYFALLAEAGLSAEKMSDFPAALVLGEPKDVRLLPGFEEGWFSVQDAGAQLAAQILKPSAGDRVLDACAAPGGKTAHMFELQPSIHMTALDISESRLQRVDENCQRLGFSADLIAADASATEEWWNGELFDKILLDVPCSASGVIRRHPDIKHLRRADDIDALQQTQREILNKNWPLLKPGGLLLYATCSLFKAENEKQMEWFLAKHKDAGLVNISAVHAQKPNEGAETATIGVQLFPNAQSHDGFYYALLQKTVD